MIVNMDTWPLEHPVFGVYTLVNLHFHSPLAGLLFSDLRDTFKGSHKFLFAVPFDFVMISTILMIEQDCVSRFGSWCIFWMTDWRLPNSHPASSHCGIPHVSANGPLFSPLLVVSRPALLMKGREEGKTSKAAYYLFESDCRQVS